MAQLDQSLGEFLDFLEHRFGRNRLMLVLTSDHGVMAIPEWLTENGKSECPLPGGRQNAYSFIGRLLWHLHWKFGPLFSIPGSLVKSAGGQITINRGFADKHDINVDNVISDVEIWLEQQAVIRQAWTREEIMQGTGPIASLYRNSFDPERSGDLVIQFEPTCLIKPGGGTTHGSPYEYDRAVPIVFYGPWFERGTIKGRARTIDIAPTLAEKLQLRYPDDLDGQPLH
jgi:arylsulfatase A-like enzyme